MVLAIQNAMLTNAQRLYTEDAESLILTAALQLSHHRTHARVSGEGLIGPHAAHQSGNLDAALTWH